MLRFPRVCVRDTADVGLEYRRVTDLAGFDSNQYQITVVPGELGDGNRFHVGEVIRVRWKAPPNHSRKDWIGIYRVCARSLWVGLADDRDVVGWSKQG